MAELTTLEKKLGEVMGLAMAAQAATARVSRMAKKDAPALVKTLDQMHREAAETEKRCKSLAEGLTGKKAAIQREASATKRKGAEMMKTYLDRSSDALDGFEFLTMAEAGEVGHWSVLAQMGKTSGNRKVLQLTQWALPIQERHLAGVMEGSKTLASQEDPAAPA